jgi:hypothetical protein
MKTAIVYPDEPRPDPRRQALYVQIAALLRAAMRLDGRKR